MESAEEGSECHPTMSASDPTAGPAAREFSAREDRAVLAAMSEALLAAPTTWFEIAQKMEDGGAGSCDDASCFVLLCFCVFEERYGDVCCCIVFCGSHEFKGNVV